MVSEQSLESVQALFESGGGRFVRPAADIAAKLGRCRGIVFDWDGVFNPGRKGETPSDFSEVDSMGTNMLRYGLWRAAGSLPFTAIISGENNATAARFAEREHFDAVYTGIRDKREIIAKITAEQGIEAEQLICVFDDINDLGMAALCGVRLMVKRDSSPLLASYAARQGACDYLAGSASYAVREVCELLLGLLGAYDEVVSSRVAVDEDYERYFEARQAVTCQIG